eukprot:Colp12_sorted_trinity150504_noHs@14534
MAHLLRFSVTRLAASAPIRQFSRTTQMLEAMSEGEQAIYDKLMSTLKCTKLEVTDISHGCGAMYRVEAESAEFAGKSLVAQHMRVKDVLKDEIKNMHGITITTRAPKN